MTDHNQTAHQSEYLRVAGPHLPIVLPGIEVTTYGGHWNAWGTERWVGLPRTNFFGRQ